MDGLDVSATNWEMLSDSEKSSMQQLEAATPAIHKVRP